MSVIVRVIFKWMELYLVFKKCDPVMQQMIFATHDSMNDDIINLPRSLRIEL